MPPRNSSGRSGGGRSGGGSRSSGSRGPSRSPSRSPSRPPSRSHVSRAPRHRARPPRHGGAPRPRRYYGGGFGLRGLPALIGIGIVLFILFQIIR